MTDWVKPLKTGINCRQTIQLSVFFFLFFRLRDLLLPLMNTSSATISSLGSFIKSLDRWAANNVCYFKKKIQTPFVSSFGVIVPWVKTFPTLSVLMSWARAALPLTYSAPSPAPPALALLYQSNHSPVGHKGGNQRAFERSAADISPLNGALAVWRSHSCKAAVKIHY